jgi:hypothetical protein
MKKIKQAMTIKQKIKIMFNIELYDFQDKFLKDCLMKNRVIGSFCRQTGKSLTISILAICEALKNPGGHIVIVGPTDRQAGELFNKILAHVKNAPIGSEIATSTQRQLIMRNNCRISALPVGDSGDTIRGMTANVLIMEEAAFIKDTIVNQVLTPMVAATQGKIIKISTPFAMNHFYNSFQSDDNYISHRYTWEDALRVGHFSVEFIEEQKKQLGENSIEFRTEYNAEFIPDEDSYFPWQLIDKCISDYEMLGEI